MVDLPKDFTEYTSQLFGTERWESFCRSLCEVPPVSVRVNPWKSVSFGGVTPLRVPWCENAYWLSDRPDFTLDPRLHAGCYYVQEAGSMFLDHVVRYLQNDKALAGDALAISSALDLCAAPGGKTTLLRAAIPEDAWLVCNEPDHKRANILMENVQKQGHHRTTVLNGYARDIARAKMSFDIIVADVPCSGEGMFRKDAGAVNEWSLQNVMKCASLQREIITDIWPCLRDGGVLVYSTCTFNTHEDEENVRWICEELGADVIAVPVQKEWNIQGSLLAGFADPVYRFIPGTTCSEGLFMAVLRKRGSDGDIATTGEPSAKQLQKVRVMHHGVPSGVTKGKDFIPDHALALSLALKDNQYPRVELTLDDALRYLHREAITLPPETAKGFVIVTYQGHTLGFVKNIGSRANNLYPKEWAIRKNIN